MSVKINALWNNYIKREVGGALNSSSVPTYTVMSLDLRTPRPSPMSISIPPGPSCMAGPRLIIAGSLVWTRLADWLDQSTVDGFFPVPRSLVASDPSDHVKAISCQFLFNLSLPTHQRASCSVFLFWQSATMDTFAWPHLCPKVTKIYLLYLRSSVSTCNTKQIELCNGNDSELKSDLPILKTIEEQKWCTSLARQVRTGVCIYARCLTAVTGSYLTVWVRFC